MASKVFLDANLILDAVLQRPNHVAAEKVLQKITEGFYMGYITSSVLHIVSYWMLKGMGVEKTKLHLLVLLQDVDLIETNKDVALDAIKSDMADIEDAFQYYTAIQHGINYFISSDKKLKKSALPHLPVLSADEFLQLQHP